MLCTKMKHRKVGGVGGQYLSDAQEKRGVLLVEVRVEGPAAGSESVEGGGGAGVGDVVEYRE